MVLYCCNVFHSTLLLEIPILLLILPHQSYMGNEIIPRLLSVSILRNTLPEGTTTVQRVEREIMQHGCEDHAMGKTRSSTSADAIRDCYA